MLMAAGLGTRLRPFTDSAPKALMPVMGVPCAQFALDALARAGVERIVANIHHHPEQMRTALKKGGPHLLVSDESALLLGSAGGIKKALALPKGGDHLLPLLAPAPFFLLNADVLCDVDLNALARRHRQLRERHGVVLTLAVAPRSPGSGQYAEIFTSSDGRIEKIGPKTSGRPFFVGAAVFEPEAFAGVPEAAPAEAVPLVFEPAIASGRAGFYEVVGGFGIWKDIGSPELWLETHLEMIARLETGALPQPWRRSIEARCERLANGIWLANGARRSQPRDWAGPCFWDGRGTPPKKLGPQAVLYGNATQSELKGGIGFEGSWVQVAKL